MDMQANREKLLRFLATIKRPDLPMERLHDTDGLVKSGLIDSLSMLEIIAFLEAQFQIDFSETGIDPAELESVQKILELIEKRGQ
ncbi:MAG: acyl carrier protein [Magnetococcales bacterium]|nr:acyl carrier protein [Magnetococcales bacterium]